MKKYWFTSASNHPHHYCHHCHHHHHHHYHQVRPWSTHHLSLLPNCHHSFKSSSVLPTSKSFLQQLFSTAKSKNNETIENRTLRVSFPPKNIQLTKFFLASDKLGASLSADVDLGGKKSYKTGKSAILNEKLVRYAILQNKLEHFISHSYPNFEIAMMETEKILPSKLCGWVRWTLKRREISLINSQTFTNFASLVCIPLGVSNGGREFCNIIIKTKTFRFHSIWIFATWSSKHSSFCKMIIKTKTLEFLVV